jgi:hypothetical protein
LIEGTAGVLERTILARAARKMAVVVPVRTKSNAVATQERMPVRALLRMSLAAASVSASFVSVIFRIASVAGKREVARRRLLKSNIWCGYIISSLGRGTGMNF